MRFGGNLSVRFPPHQNFLFSFGHDEVIFNKNAFSSKCWFGPKGEQPLVPKEDGTGVMVSGMQSREFGFGFPELTDENLLSINSIRSHKLYNDVNAATKICGSKEKPLFKKGDYFNFGANKDGYWSLSDKSLYPYTSVSG